MNRQGEDAQAKDALKALCAKVDRAQAAFCAAGLARRAIDEAIARCAMSLAAPPPLPEGDAGFAAFADIRRRAMRLEFSRLQARAKELYTEEKTRRAAFETLLRRKIALEGSIAAADEERRRIRARRG